LTVVNVILHLEKPQNTTTKMKNLFSKVRSTSVVSSSKTDTTNTIDSYLDQKPSHVPKLDGLQPNPNATKTLSPVQLRANSTELVHRRSMARLSTRQFAMQGIGGTNDEDAKNV
jgi:hypothetical protein